MVVAIPWGPSGGKEQRYREPRAPDPGQLAMPPFRMSQNFPVFVSSCLELVESWSCWGSTAGQEAREARPTCSPKLAKFTSCLAPAWPRWFQHFALPETALAEI